MLHSLNPVICVLIETIYPIIHESLIHKWKCLSPMQWNRLLSTGDQFRKIKDNCSYFGWRQRVGKIQSWVFFGELDQVQDPKLSKWEIEWALWTWDFIYSLFCYLPSLLPSFLFFIFSYDQQFASVFHSSMKIDSLIDAVPQVVNIV